MTAVMIRGRTPFKMCTFPMQKGMASPTFFVLSVNVHRHKSGQRRIREAATGTKAAQPFTDKAMGNGAMFISVRVSDGGPCPIERYENGGSHKQNIQRRKY